MLRCALPLAATLLFAAPLAAQDFDTTTVFGRVMQRRATALDQNPVFSGGGGTFDDMDLARLDDSSVVTFAALLSRAVGRMPEGGCVTLGAADDLAVLELLAGRSDSLEAEQWAGLLEEIAWLQVEKGPPKAVGTEEMAYAMLGTLLMHAPLKDRTRLGKSRSRPDWGCLVGVWILDRLTTKSPSRTAPIIRYFFVAADEQ